MKKVTIYDIAKEANVSITMVSRVLNKSGPVKKEKEERILEVIKKYNYVPNALARGLIKKETKLIGVIMPDISNPFFLQIYLEIEKKAHEHGYNVILCNSMSSFEVESRYLKSLIEKQVDGIVFIGGRITTYNIEKKYIDELKEINNHIPIITINGIYNEVGTVNIQTDEDDGMKQLMKYIHKSGYRKIGIILGVKNNNATETKLQYFKKYIEEFALSTKDEWIYYGDFTVRSGMAGAQYFIDLDDRPSVIMCVNDIVAMGAIRHFSEKGFKIPNDIAITGFDDIGVSELIVPNLTTVNQNYKKIGKAVVDSIANIDKIVPGTSITINTKLVIRESCR